MCSRISSSESFCEKQKVPITKYIIYIAPFKEPQVALHDVGVGGGMFKTTGISVEMMFSIITHC